ncbi:MAG: caffeoyl-CoA O-methyltransferase [Actinomycetota bacterium]|nr:caffeoyl-CoA O-methyltransferase [Actinomycetota bacterium]
MTDASVAPKSFFLGSEVAHYLVDHGTPPDAVQLALIEETRELGPVAGMQISPEQGAFLTILTRLVGARSAVEVGTFTGYSSLCIARGLPADGHLLCCDVSDEWTAMARRAWSSAGVESKIELKLAPGADTLRSLPQEETIDLAFIDADKPSYAVYYEEILTRLRPNGVLLVDNVLWSGRVVDPDADDDNTKAIKAFNDMVAADDRVEAVMLPIADGLTICRKK